MLIFMAERPLLLRRTPADDDTERPFCLSIPIDARAEIESDLKIMREQMNHIQE
jgi:hypothetical protein